MDRYTRICFRKIRCFLFFFFFKIIEECWEFYIERERNVDFLGVRFIQKASFTGSNVARIAI